MESGIHNSVVLMLNVLILINCILKENVLILRTETGKYSGVKMHNVSLKWFK